MEGLRNRPVPLIRPSSNNLRPAGREGPPMCFFTQPTFYTRPTFSLDQFHEASLLETSCPRPIKKAHHCTFSLCPVFHSACYFTLSTSCPRPVYRFYQFDITQTTVLLCFFTRPTFSLGPLFHSPHFSTPIFHRLNSSNSAFLKKSVPERQKRLCSVLFHLT